MNLKKPKEKWGTPSNFCLIYIRGNNLQFWKIKIYFHHHFQIFLHFLFRDYARGGTYTLIQQFFDKKINFSRAQTKQLLRLKI